MVDNLFGPLGRVHKIKRVHGSDNTNKRLDIRPNFLVLEFGASRIKDTCVPDGARVPIYSVRKRHNTHNDFM